MDTGVPSGTIFARDYRVVRPIASGGMGSVYRVEQLSTRKHRALKILHTRFGFDPRGRERFVREATVGADIASEHVVEVIAAGIDDERGLPWLVMELLDGLDLARAVAHAGPLGPTRALAVFRQLGHGLAAAHAARIVHRDLKPENVFVARSKRAGATFTIKILDFGIAKLTREAATTDTASVGSPMWMAPEQINASPLGPPADVWALGLLAFWALTGQVYWKAAHAPRVTTQSLFAEQLFAEIEPASRRAAQYGAGDAIDDDFDAWFAGCVQRDPSHRFADARAAIRALVSVLEPRCSGDPLAQAPLLPPPGQEPARTPAVPAILRPTRPNVGRLDGTTGDVLGGETPPTISATAVSEDNATVSDSTDQRGPPTQRVATQVPVPVTPVTAPVVRPRGGWIAAAIAVPVAVLVGGVGLYAVFGGGEAGEQTDPVPTASERPVAPTAIPKFEDDGPGAVEDDAREDFDEPSGAPAFKFLGWSSREPAFVIRADHPSCGLGVAHVQDALTGERLDTYLLQRSGDACPAELAEVIAKAKTPSAWVERAEELALVQPDARRMRPRGTGEVMVEARDAPLDTKVRLQPKRAGFDFAWWGFAPEGSGTSPSPLGPRLLGTYVDAGVSWPVADGRIPFDYDRVARLSTSKGTPRVEGTLRFYWNPDGDRYVIVMTAAARGDHRQHVESRWVVRAAGPPIRLLDAGAGPAALRRTATELAHAGFPVAQAADASDAQPSVIYFRRTDARAEALARALATTLPGEIPTEGLTTTEWTAATVVLGADAR